jgi:hypothetical protein
MEVSPLVSLTQPIPSGGEFFIQSFPARVFFISILLQLPVFKATSYLHCEKEFPIKTCFQFEAITCFADGFCARTFLMLFTLIMDLNYSLYGLINE